jgi:hypothetical protein
VEIPPAVLAKIDACWSAGLGCAWVDTSRAAAFQARYMLLALEAREPARVARGLATEASQLAAIGGRKRTTRAREIIGRALSTEPSAGTSANGHIANTFTLLMAGSIEFYASRWSDALDRCSRAEALLREHQTQSEWELMTAHTLSLASLAYLGRLRALRERQRSLLVEARDRGNVLAAVCLACGPANIGWLASGDPDEAQRQADEAIAPWHESHQLPSYLHLLATTQIALYRDDVDGALAKIANAWPRLVTSMSLYVQNLRVTLRHLRARSALAVLARSDRPLSRLRRGRLLRLAESEARKLADEDVAWAPALARAIEGGLAAVRGQREAAAEHLAHAGASFRGLDMALHAAAADHERGRLLGGGAGRALRLEAESWMRDERVVSPDALAAMLVPGIAADV